MGQDDSVSWPFLQAVQEDVERDSSTFNHYMGQRMFQQDSEIIQQPLDLTASTATGDRLPDNMMQMTSVALGTEVALSHLQDSLMQSQNQQALPDSLSNGDQDMDGFDSSYFNEATIPENEPEEHNHSDIQRVEDSKSPQGPCKDLRVFEQSAEASIEESVGDSRDGNRPGYVVPVDDEDDGSSSEPESPASSSSGSDDVAHDSLDAGPSHCEQPLVPNAPIDSAQAISDTDRASDLLKALEDKGVLAGLIERLGYQKPTEPEVISKVALSARPDTSRNAHICTQLGCAKGFSRACELK